MPPPIGYSKSTELLHPQQLCLEQETAWLGRASNQTRGDGATESVDVAVCKDKPGEFSINRRIVWALRYDTRRPCGRVQRRSLTTPVPPSTHGRPRVKLGKPGEVARDLVSLSVAL
jgi:hypothetical protein